MIKIKNLTKAEALEKISKSQQKIKIKIPHFIYFSKERFLKNPEKYLSKIKKEFFKKKIILRSSSKKEDLLSGSNAGKYKSFSNLHPGDKKNIKVKIYEILKDFSGKKDQVLVQEFLLNPDIAGVIFTRSYSNNAPYYIVNFDRSKKTNLITSGKNNPTMRTMIIYKNKLAKTNFWSKYLLKIKKIEKLMNNDRLDIEFSIKKGNFYLLQCRPLKSVKKIRSSNLDKVLKNIEKKVEKLKRPIHNLSGKTNCFSNMSDWNPAEMIGVKPSKLALSLYSELITDEIWAQQRFNYGYKDVRPNPLMINFAGSPYIDLRVDFNSFMPKDLPISIQKKALNFYLNKLKNKPQLHDKIEFEIIETCFDFNSKKKLLKFLSKKETAIYLKKLKNLTNNLISSEFSVLEKELKQINILESKIKSIKDDNISDVQKIYFLIKYCKKYGTLPFAGIARCAFISTKLIRTLLELKILDEKDYKNFFESINTVSKQIYNESKFLKKNNQKKIFLDKFGHLRPSMYNISSKNYKENYKNYFSQKNKENITLNKFKLDNKKIKKINYIFKKNSLKFKSNQFFQFTKSSIELREYSKMIFSKAIDNVFEILISLGKKINIKRNDLEYLSIKKILDLYNNLDVEQIKNSLKYEIRKSKQDEKVTSLIEFPEIINNSNDVYFHEQKTNYANFVTTKSINGELIDFSNVKNYKRLNNKIVILKNADPGFDFIFSYNIKGLITEYGGANSHMSIRCLELGIPAIIGIGAKNFELIKNKKYIQINPNQKNYKIIQ